jgi:energy-coupling factor transporter ATP-binding protein EcfA2
MKQKLKFYVENPSILKGLLYLMLGRYEIFKVSKLVSSRLRATLENAGLVLKEKTEDGDVIEYPELEIWADEHNFYLKFDLIPGQTIKQWESKADAFASALKCSLLDFEIARGECKIILNHTEVRADKVPFKVEDSHSIVMGFGAGSPIEWKFDENPHALVIGETGSGKSTFMRNVLIQFRNDWDVKVIDGKMVEFSFLSDYGFDVCSDDGNFLSYIESVSDEVNRRFEIMKSERVNDYRKMNWKPLFFVIDEFIYMIESIPKKEGKDEPRERAYRMLRNIVLKGRAAGVNLILIMQRPDSNYVPTVIRDNLTCKIALGAASETAYEMAFGSQYRKLTPLRMGQGYAMVGKKVEQFGFANYEMERFMENMERRRRGGQASDGEAQPTIAAAQNG